MRTRKSVILIPALLALIAACIYGEFRSTEYTCLECRATLTERRLFGIFSKNITYHAYSKSALAHDSAHPHRWRWCGTEHTISFFESSIGCGRQHPIWQLSEFIQAQYAQRVPATTFQETLQSIDSPNREIAEAALEQIYKRVIDEPKESAPTP